ncbi:branched-chain amino acid ABC transporter permease [Nocardia goodfellowii]
MLRIWRVSVLLRHLSLALLSIIAIIAVLESVSDYRSVQLASMAYLAIAAGGLTMLTGLNGQLSLGHGAFLAIGAYTTALILQKSANTPILVVLLTATAVTMVIGAVVGVAAARLHGPYVAGATLALAIGVPGLAIYFDELLGGEQGLTVRALEVPDWLGDLAFFVTGNEMSTSKYVAYLGWFCLVVVFVLLANLSAGRVGRRWRAVRDDEVAASLAGINLGRTRVQSFVVSTGCAGLGGAVMALSVRLTAPSGFPLTLSLVLLSAIVLGGLGSLVGALIGAALLTFLPPAVTDLGLSAGLTDIQAAELTPLIYGLTTIAVIVLAPTGLVGIVGSLLTRRSRHRDRQLQTYNDQSGSKEIRQ